jgi:hypothetical protein
MRSRHINAGGCRRRTRAGFESSISYTNEAACGVLQTLALQLLRSVQVT